MHASTPAAARFRHHAAPCAAAELPRRTSSVPCPHHTAHHTADVSTQGTARARARPGHVARAAAHPQRADADVHSQQPDQQQPSQQQQQQPLEPLVPVKQRLSSCPVCGGSGRITCAECRGEGVLGRGGYSRRNPLNQQRAIGSKWTAMAETLGWRHFRVTAVRKLGAGRQQHMFLLLAASCDNQQQLWVNAQTLRNRACFAAGWLQMRELLGEGEDGAPDGAAATSGRECQVCSGLGWKACASCDGRGRAILVEL